MGRREGGREKESGGGEEGWRGEIDGRKEQIRYVGKEEEWDDCKRRGGGLGGGGGGEGMDR